MQARNRTTPAWLLYLGFAVIGLVLSLRLPANPIGWLYAASGLIWSLNVPGSLGQ